MQFYSTKKTYKILILMLLFHQIMYAQNFPTVHYTTREGLASMQAMTILKDSRGFLWAGTKLGLSKYDGDKFTTYRRSQGDSLASDVISNLIEDKNGNIWIDTPVGISRFDGVNFKSWKPSSDEGRTFTTFITNDNRIVLRSEKSHYFEMVNDKLKPWDIDNPPKLQTVKGFHYNSFENSFYEETVSSTVPNQYFLYKVEQNHLKLVSTSSNTLVSIYPIGNYGNILLRKLPDNSLAYWFQASKNSKEILILTVSDKNIKAHQSASFNFPFSFQGNLMILEKNTSNFLKIGTQFLDPTNIQVDDSGIWAGSEIGLWRVIDNGVKYIPEERDAVAWGMVEDRDNKIWTIHYNSASPIRVHEGNKTTLKNDYQKTLANQFGKPTFMDHWYFNPINDRYNALWFAYESGLIRYDGKAYQVISKDGMCFYVAEDKKRNLILASYAGQDGGGGVNVIENKPPYRVISTLLEKDGLSPNNFMLCIFIDSKGRHWYGSDGGLTLYDYDQKKAFRYPMSSPKVPFRTVIHICEDSWGHLWFATTKGLFLYDEKDKSFQKVGQKGIWGPVVSVGNLDKTHLICGNSESFFVLDLLQYHKNKSVVIKTFNHRNGFLGYEPGQAGILNTHDGKVWVNSSGVITIFDPKQLDLSIASVKPNITRLNNTNLPFTVSAKDSVYRLPHGLSDDIKIEFGTLGFEKPTKPLYSYKLNNNEWSQWQEQDFVNISNLADGKYTLALKTQIAGENVSMKISETRITFRTNLYFWQSPNFYKYLLGLIFGLLVVITLRFLFAIRDRKNIIKQQKELDFLKVVALQSQMNPHFIFNVLGVLQGKILMGEPQTANDQLVKLATLVRSYLEASMIDPDNARKSIYSTEISLSKEIELLELFVEFEHLKAKNVFTYQFIIDPKIKPDNYSIPPMIVQPIVENAIKRGLLNLAPNETGKLEIKVDLTDDCLIFSVLDTGVGRVKAAQIKESSVRALHKSRASELVNKRIKILNDAGYNIQIEYNDVEPQGTIVVVRFYQDEQ